MINGWLKGALGRLIGGQGTIGPPRPPVVHPIPPTAPVPHTPLPTSADLLGLVNEARRRVGLPPLTSDARLILAASDHATDMHARGYFGHMTPEGRSWLDRARARDYAAPVMEVIASGQRSATEAVDSWLGSPGHRRILLDASARRFGSAVAGTKWVALVGEG